MRTPRLYLVRHAVTAANLEGRRLGSIDEPLSDGGREQALALARRMSALPIDAVWSSPLSRARETAEIVASALAVDVRLEDDLREMALGPWEGLTEQEIARRFPEQNARWQADPASLTLPGHEGLEATRQRVAAALERIMDASACALCVTHLTVIRLAWVHVHRLPSRAYAGITPDHCSPVELEGRAGAVLWREVA